MDTKSWCEKVAALGVDMLVDSGLITNEDTGKATAIIAQEIQIRLTMGDYPPSDEIAEQDRFIARHKDSDFRHREELFESLASGKCNLVTGSDSSPITCSRLLKVYQRRAEHLQAYATPHAKSLRDDVLSLCESLVKTSNKHCRMWSFALPPNSDFAVFEGTENGEILGCVFAKDKRLTDADEWEKLWQGDG